MLSQQRLLAFEIKDAKDRINDLTHLNVGYNQKAEFGDSSRPGGAEPTTEVAPFKPGSPPKESPHPGDKMPTYDTVMAVHTQINAQINAVLNANPALYALTATGAGNGGTDVLVGADLAEVKTKLTNACRPSSPTPPRRKRPFRQTSSSSRTCNPSTSRCTRRIRLYQKPFERAAAMDYVESEHGNADNASTFMTVAVMALIAAVEIGSGGTAGPVIAALISASASDGIGRR